MPSMCIAAPCYVACVGTIEVYEPRRPTFDLDFLSIKLNDLCRCGNFSTSSPNCTSPQILPYHQSPMLTLT